MITNITTIIYLKKVLEKRKKVNKNNSNNNNKNSNLKIKYFFSSLSFFFQFELHFLCCCWYRFRCYENEHIFSFLVCFALHLYGVFCSIAYRKLHCSSAPSWLDVGVGPYTNWPPWLTWSMRWFCQNIAEFHEGIVEAKLSKNFCIKIPLPGTFWSHNSWNLHGRCDDCGETYEADHCPREKTHWSIRSSNL